MSKLFTVLVIATVAMWSYTVATYNVSVAKSTTLYDVYTTYNYITIHEDGSYEGELIGGVQVTGCIEGALCDKD